MDVCWCWGTQAQARTWWQLHSTVLYLVPPNPGAWLGSELLAGQQRRLVCRPQTILGYSICSIHNTFHNCFQIFSRIMKWWLTGSGVVVNFHLPERLILWRTRRVAPTEPLKGVSGEGFGEGVGTPFPNRNFLWNEPVNGCIWWGSFSIFIVSNIY